MVTVKILVLMLFIVWSELANTVSVDDAFEFSRNDKNASFPSGNETNFSDVSIACHLKIDESSLKNIVKLIHHKKKNAIELNVWIESFNNTFNRSRLPTGIKWANQMGRTLISLIAEAEDVQSMILSSYTSTLTPGVSVVDIVVYEKTEGCLLFSGGNASDIVFDFLLHRLYPHDNEYDSDYQLCIKNTDSDETAKYNCCTLLGRERIPICSDYSSILIVSSTGLLVGAVFLFVLFAFPLIVEHLSHAQNECIEHKISDSPMSLSSIFHIIFIEGHGPVKSLGRRLVITVIILVTALPEWDFDNPALSVLVYSWALLFPFFDAHNFNEEVDNTAIDANSFNFFIFREDPTKIIAFPFNLKFLWKKVNRLSVVRRYLKLNLVNSAANYQQSATTSRISERSRLLPHVELRQSRNDPEQDTRRLLDVPKYCLSIVILLMLYLLIALPTLCLSTFFTLYGRYIYNIRGKKYTDAYGKVKNLALSILGSLTFIILIFSIVKFSVLSFYFITGLYLNAGLYSTYFVPLSILLFYSWNNWKSSVEEKYLELNTRLYKVCQEGGTNTAQTARPVTETPSESSGHAINDTDSNNNDGFQASTSSAFVKRFKIKLDENGEPVIPKSLYDIVREKFLPYDAILVPYFEGVFVVVIFAYFLFIFMSLAEESGISSNAQIISTLAATSLPLLFDIIWKKKSDGQKAADNLALKCKLKHVLTVCSSNDATGEIIVEFTGEMPTDPFGNHAA